MTKEEKQLLLIDLCARLPYNVIVEKDGRKCTALTITNNGEVEIERGSGYYRYYWVQDVRPYLRPMSSMTEKERNEKMGIITTVYDGEIVDDEFVNVVQYIDWLDAHHFDYRGLIEKGLAIEAPEGMYKTE